MYSYVGWAPGSREEAVASLQASYAALQHAVMTAAGWRADPYSPPTGPIWGWWSTVGIPVIDQWQKFYATQTAWGRFWTDWRTYEQWYAKLQELRAAAIAAGVPGVR